MWANSPIRDFSHFCINCVKEGDGVTFIWNANSHSYWSAKDLSHHDKLNRLKSVLSSKIHTHMSSLCMCQKLLSLVRSIGKRKEKIFLWHTSKRKWNFYVIWKVFFSLQWIYYVCGRYVDLYLQMWFYLESMHLEILYLPHSLSLSSI